MTQELTPVFLLSLPRSGSTLLQRILATHHEIGTAPEPWILLPLLYARRKPGIAAEYHHSMAARAIDEFLGGMDAGEDIFRAAIRRFALDLYGNAAQASPRYFLDKTPRYHLIANELARTFPESRFIVLWRNPLAVANSILRTWGRAGGWNLKHWTVDLETGPPNLLAVTEVPGLRVHCLRFEDLVQKPEPTIQALMKFLDLRFEPSMLREFSTVRFDGMGDPTGQLRFNRITERPAYDWTSNFATPFWKLWAHGYLKRLGDDILAAMGYNRSELLNALKWGRISPRQLIGDVRAGSAYAVRMLTPWRGRAVLNRLTLQIPRELANVDSYDRNEKGPERRT